MLHATAATGGVLDAFVVRKQGKAHGLQRRIEGSPVDGRRVLAVEDTSTTGGSVLTAVEALREAGAEVGRGERPAVGQPRCLDRLAGAGVPVDDDGDADDLGLA
jgi:orotate phosphoribosyltransferase